MSAGRRDAWLEVDLAAIEQNLETIRGLVGGTVKVAPVVKAEAYGHGLVPVARALAPLADALCVATLDEALTLRSENVPGRIVLLYPVPEAAIPDTVRASIELTVMSHSDAAAVVRAAAVGGPDFRPRVQLAIDTGMTRGGLRPDEAVSVAARLAEAPGIAITGTWSHLCCPDDATKSAEQVARFETALHHLAHAGLPAGERHTAASGAIFGGTAPSFDLVRPGLAVFGVLDEGLPRSAAGAAAAAAALRPALTLKAHAVALEDIAPGTSVGYGATWRAERPSRIAILPLGYGDGYARSTGPGAVALVRGRRAPVVGIISMDALAVDVTDAGGIDVIDEFVLLGRQGDARIEVGELARARNTIAWEVLAGMAARLDRVYHPGTAAGRSRITT